MVQYLSFSKKRVCILFKYFESSTKKIKSVYKDRKKQKINKWRPPFY